MKRFFVFLGVVLSTIGSAVSAQEVDSIAPLQKSSWGDAKTCEIVDFVPDVSLDTRFWCNRDFSEQRGRFSGDGIYFNIDGYITKNLSYSLQQRIASTYYEDNHGFNGTNWLTLTYELGSFEFTAGKNGVLAGGFENDFEDFDSYYEMNSMFYNMLDSWQWGTSVTWYPAEDHSLTLQAINSPLQNGEDNLFGYDLAWRMESDFYESFWTVNMWEYEKGKYVKNLSLGNAFYFGDFSILVDYQTRAADLGRIFVDDFTLTVRPSYEFGDWGCLFAKFGWERVPEGLPYEFAYEDCIGSDYIFYGAGFEYYPLKENRNLRLHAAWSANNQGGNYLNIGLKFRFDLTSAAKKLFGK